MEQDKTDLNVSRGSNANAMANAIIRILKERGQVRCWEVGTGRSGEELGPDSGWGWGGVRGGKANAIIRILNERGQGRGRVREVLEVARGGEGLGGGGD